MNFVVLILMLCIGQHAASIRVVDLSKPEPKSAARSGRFPGYAMSASTAGVTGPPSYKLPLSLSSVRVIEDPTGMLIEFTMKNTGREAFGLPVGVDCRVIHRDGNLGRRTGSFYLVYGETSEQSSETVKVVCGSRSAKTSMVTLAAGESVLVRLRIAGTATVKEMKSKISRVLYREYAIEDGRYMIDRMSDEVLSPPVVLERQARGQ